MPIRERVNWSYSILRGGRRLLFALTEILRDEPGVLADLRLELLGRVLVLLQEATCGLAALSDALALEGKPRARLLHHAGLDAKIEQLAGFGDALAVHDVELDLL